MIKTVLAVLLLATPSFAVDDEPKLSEEQILTWLRELQPLPKVHYSWPPPFKTISDNVLFEFVRITHTVNLTKGV